jgi:agmatinase
VVGIDVVEVSPPYDTAEITAFLANRVVLEMLSGIAYRRRAGTWASIPATLLEGRS